MAHATDVVGRRRNSSSRTGTAGMAPTPGGIGLAPARGSIGTGAAASAVATTAATATTTATTMCDGDVAGRQMPATQCDGASGQCRTNDRGYYEPLQPLWRAFHDQFSFQV
jgi:hypothetical protein